MKMKKIGYLLILLSLIICPYTTPAFGGTTELIEDVITITPTSFTYTGSGQTPTVNTLSGRNATCEYKIKGTPDGTYTNERPINAGDYTIKASVQSDFQYSSATKIQDFTIAPKPITVRARGGSSTYGNYSPGSWFDIDGLVSGDRIEDVIAGLSTNLYIVPSTLPAGTYTIEVTGVQINNNYKLNEDWKSPSAKWIVEPIEITVRVKGNSTYGDSQWSQRFDILGGFVNGDNIEDVIVGLSTNFNIDEFTPAGTYAIEITGTPTNNPNYKLNDDWNSPAEWIVEPREIVVRAKSGYSSYGDNPWGWSQGFDINGLRSWYDHNWMLREDKIEDVIAGFGTNINIDASTPVGTYTIEVTGVQINNNYKLNDDWKNPVEWIVKPKEITARAKSGNSTYGDNPWGWSQGFDIDGLWYDQIEDVIAGFGTNINIDESTPAGTYTIEVTGVQINNNYKLNDDWNSPAEWIVKPRIIALGARNGNSIYGEHPWEWDQGFNVWGEANGEMKEDIIAELSTNINIDESTPAGIYTIEVTGTLANNPNYILNDEWNRPAEWIVEPREIYINARGGYSTYGDNPDNPGFDVWGLVNEDKIEDVIAGSTIFNIEASTPAGTYTIEVTGGVLINNNNYKLNEEDWNSPAEWTVEPRSITIQSNEGRSTYGDIPENPGITAVGLVNGDVIDDVFNGTNDFNINATTPVGTYNINVTGEALANNNYTIADKSTVQWVVEPKPITVRSTGGNSFYGDSPENPGFTATGLVNNEKESVLTGLKTDFDIDAFSPVGNYAINVTGSLTNKNYTLTERNISLWTVKPRAITLIANGGSSVYGDSPENPGIDVNGLANGDKPENVIAGLSSDFNINATTPVGTYTINAMGTVIGENYTIANKNTAQWSVEPKAIVLTANGGSSVYGETPTNPGFTATGLVNNETEEALSGLSTDFNLNASSSVGDYTVNVVGTLTNGNYTITERKTFLWTVIPKAITVTASGGNSVYGDAPENPEFTATGLVNNETKSVLNGLSCDFGINATTPVGNYTVDVAGTLTNKNYTIANKNTAQWNVAPKAITVSVGGGSSVYGDTPEKPEFTAVGLVNDETKSVLTGLDANFNINATTPTGIYTIDVVGILTNENYTVTNKNTAQWTVEPKAVALTVNGGNSVYGDAPTNPGFTATGLVNNETEDALAGLIANFNVNATTPIGIYTIDVAGTLTNENYIISDKSTNQWTVEPKAISISTNGGSSVYGEAPESPSIDVNGLVNGDKPENVITGLSNDFNINATTPVGAYTVNVTGTLSNENYILDEEKASEWIVEPKPITIIASDISTDTDNLDVELTYNIGPKLINGDRMSGLLTCNHEGKAGEYPIEQGTLTAGSNYVITYISGTLTITDVIAVEDVSIEALAQIYPNPVNAGSILTIATRLADNELTEAHALLYDATGRLLSTLPITDTEITMTAPNSAGNYIVKVMTKDRSQHIKLIVK